MLKSLDAPLQVAAARLHLRKPKLEDPDPIFASFATDPDVVGFLSWEVHQSVQDTLDFLQFRRRSWSNETTFAYIIELQNSPEIPIGMIDVRRQGPRVAFGYVLARPLWGRGYMTEALSSLVGWSLNQPDIWRASAYCDADNSASAKVMEKAGMEFEGVLHRYGVFRNVSSEPGDCVMYAKVRARRNLIGTRIKNTR
ncbi:MAG: GNAT family N-acetyltransferase [Rhodobacteraceae bacterium]|nr:GNAT family N-acetyltransferase [Paracoccaceae bacterium]MCY4139786.1 GNAT family N-acetyltransferase [Paracoccaceae bacterium]